jgi:hypothetical protein
LKHSAVNPEWTVLLAVLIDQIKAFGVNTPSRRERLVRGIAITESALPITEEFLMIVADRLASHLKVRIGEILATRLLDPSAPNYVAMLVSTCTNKRILQ